MDYIYAPKITVMSNSLYQRIEKLIERTPDVAPGDGFSSSGSAEFTVGMEDDLKACFEIVLYHEGVVHVVKKTEGERHWKTFTGKNWGAFVDKSLCDELEGIKKVVFAR